MRMIDADKMLERLEAWNTSDNTEKALYNFAWNRIAEQPTAYDVGKVVEQLEELKETAYECYGRASGAYVAMCNAIEIVKRGGEQE